MYWHSPDHPRPPLKGVIVLILRHLKWHFAASPVTNWARAVLLIAGPAVLLAGGCAGGPTISSSTGTFTELGGYQLADDEKKLDCKRIRGRMQIRIVQVRAVRSREQTSLASRAMQQGLQPVYGGTTYGADPDRDVRRDIAQIEAYNRRLAEMQCPQIDVQKELSVPYGQ